MKVKGMMGDYAEYVDIPYFGLIFTVVVLTAGMDFLEAAITLIVVGLFSLVSAPAAMVIGLIMMPFPYRF